MSGTISAEEYFRMGAAGVFAPDARLELIDGEIIEMAPIDPPHAGAVKRLLALFAKRAGDKAVLSVQDPLVISGRSVPQPDIALLAPRSDYYSDAHPTASDVFLVVEVSDTTLRFDLRIKVPLYARCGVAEAWVVDVNERVIHVFRDPDASVYGTTFVAQSGDRIACLASTHAWLEVAEIFPD
jgi:Uma2 family endonuclease